MKLHFIGLNIFFCVVITAAYADLPCKNYTSDYDKSYCLAKFLGASDKGLNESYKNLQHCLNDKQESLLKKSQLTWLKYRESFCTSSKCLSMMQCSYDLNIKRTQFLQDLDRECEAGYINDETISRQTSKLPDFISNLGSKWALKSDTGKFLSVCNNCIYAFSVKYPNSATIHIDTVDNFFVQWTILKGEQDNFLLKNGNGKLLARTQSDDHGVVMVYDTDANNPNAQWQINPLGNGKISLSDDSGHYLCRCSHCYQAAYPDVADTHCTSSNDPAAQWTPVSPSPVKYD